MPIYERRQHFRINDHIYFDFEAIQPGLCYSEQSITEHLLEQGNDHYFEVMHYFQSLDQELSQLTQALSESQPVVTHYLNLINAKVDCLARHLLMGNKIQLKKVNISLGGMSFKTKERMEIDSHLKMIIYTKPKMIPIIVNAKIVRSEFLNADCNKTVVEFENLTAEQEQLLSQHLMLTQLNCKTY